MKKPSSERYSLPVIHNCAAGIDIGSRFHVVAVPADITKEPVQNLQGVYRRLGTHGRLVGRAWDHTVAMESTGVYWIPVYEIWRRTACMSSWPMRGTPVQCRDAKLTLTMRNGSSVYMPVACCVPASILIEKSLRYAAIYACENATSITPLRISSTCRRRSST
ncbi:hypothetical protein ULF88_11615 [Halopseudomonas pachastrellae]|nr:hypothetical protein [Halopseudomonas pachastrellae]